MSKVRHRYPNTSDHIEITKAKTKSVGIPAIWQSLRHMGKHMDLPDAIKASFKMNQKSGFDCPGCAWPDPDDDRSSLGEYCENGIKALAEEATKRKADADFFAAHSIVALSEWSEYKLGKSGRLTQPMYLKEGGTHYEPIEWQVAFNLIAKHLKALNNPDEAIFYTSGRTSNEAAFLYGTFARAYGTNNLPDCSNMCHECSGYALSKTLGIGKGAVTLEDLHQSELILVIGQNPGTNHPRMMSALERCKENGGQIVAINPLKEAGLKNYINPQRLSKILSNGTDLADLYLPVSINGDIPLLKAIMLLLLENDKEERKKGHASIIDDEFIKTHTSGYGDFINQLKTEDFDTCVQMSGVDEALIRSAASLIATRKKMIICWAMGITQHENGVQNVQEIVNLLLLRGSIGIPGAGPCPVRGHSNVQGDRTMGIWEKMPESFLSKLENAFQVPIARKHGYATVPAIKAMYEKKAKVFIGMGGNFVSATPDTDYTARALRNCHLTVHVSTKPNRSHLVHGKEALILPTLGRSEVDVQKSGYQFVSVENSMGVVHNSKGVLPPKSEHLKSEVAIITGIAQATLHDRSKQVDWSSLCDDYDFIREKIEAVIPGFDNYNQRVRLGKGFYLPNGVKTRDFKTSDGKGQFTVNGLPDLSLNEGEFRLTTLRAHDQYNTTLYGLDDRYRGIKNGREVLLMNAKDLEDLNLKNGDAVDVTSEYEGVQRTIHNFKVVSYDIPKRCIGAYFPEANPLVPVDLINPETHTPVSKNIVVRINRRKRI